MSLAVVLDAATDDTLLSDQNDGTSGRRPPSPARRFRTARAAGRRPSQRGRNRRPRAAARAARQHQLGVTAVQRGCAGQRGLERAAPRRGEPRHWAERRAPRVGYLGVATGCSGDTRPCSDRQGATRGRSRPSRKQQPKESGQQRSAVWLLVLVLMMFPKKNATLFSTFPMFVPSLSW